MHTMPPGTAPQNLSITSSFLQQGHVPGSQLFGVTTAASAQQPPIPTSAGQQPTPFMPTFALTDPATFDGSNAAYWFMALLSMTGTTLTGAQECDILSGNPIPASTSLQIQSLSPLL